MIVCDSRKPAQARLRDAARPVTARRWLLALGLGAFVGANGCWRTRMRRLSACPVYPRVRLSSPADESATAQPRRCRPLTAMPSAHRWAWSQTTWWCLPSLRRLRSTASHSGGRQCHLCAERAEVPERVGLPLPPAPPVLGFGLRTRLVRLDHPIDVVELRVMQAAATHLCGGQGAAAQGSRVGLALVLLAALIAGGYLAWAAWGCSGGGGQRWRVGARLELGHRGACLIVGAAWYRDHQRAIDAHCCGPWGSDSSRWGWAGGHGSARRVRRPKRAHAGASRMHFGGRIAWPDVAWWLGVIALIMTLRLSYLITGDARRPVLRGARGGLWWPGLPPRPIRRLWPNGEHGP